MSRTRRTYTVKDCGRDICATPMGQVQHRCSSAERKFIMMLNPTRRVLFSTLVVVFCFLFPAAAGPSPFTFQIAAKAPLGSDVLGLPAPEFELQQIFGNSVKSGDLKGKVVVLDLWATWCAPCIDVIQNLEAIADKYKGKNVQVIGITVESGSIEDVKAKLTELKIRYPVLYGTQQTSSDFRTIGFPTTFVLTRNWTFHHLYLGKLPNKAALI